ncbi:MAG TPA: CZB domain-containing protein [Candidatus Binataceae bacterium]|nr:CZB domain-containing protein [Candidatus Binataceae bacterium]
MSIQDQIKSAIAAHGMWKARLTSAIDSGSSDVSPATIQLDDHCEFGKWLHYGEAAKFKDSPHYTRCLALHRQFHLVAAKVLMLALSGKKEQAARSMGPMGDWTNASADLTKAMMEWRSLA